MSVNEIMENIWFIIRQTRFSPPATATLLYELVTNTRANRIGSGLTQWNLKLATQVAEIK